MSRWNENIISNINKEAIDKYIEQQEANGNSWKPTIDSHRSNIKRVLVLINKDYNNITKEDLNKAFSKIKEPKSKELVKIKFRCFLRYLNLNELADHIVIKSSVFKKPTKTEDDILTEEEITKLRNAPISIRNKAMIELFLTTGIRRSELVNLKLQNVVDKKDEIIIKITKSKTNERNISIIPYPDNPTAFHPNNLMSYIENHQFKNDTTKPLFFSLSTRTYGEKMNPSSLTLLFKTIQKKSKLTKKLTPHIFRHTAASNDGYHFTTGELELKYGWAKGSDMAKFYCHLTETRMNEHIKRMAGLTPEKVKSESECPFCFAINNINAKICHQCKRNIDRKDIAKRNKEYEEREKATTDTINKLTKEIEDIKNDYRKLAKMFKPIKKAFDKGNYMYDIYLEGDIENEIERGKLKKTLESSLIKDGNYKIYLDKKLMNNYEKTEIKKLLDEVNKDRQSEDKPPITVDFKKM